MKVIQQVISLTMAFVMLLTTTPPVQASGAVQQSALAEEIQEAVAAQKEVSPYGANFPTEKEMYDDLLWTFKKAEGNASLLKQAMKEADDEIAKLPAAEQEQITKEVEGIKAKADKYLEEHKKELFKYGGKQRAQVLALNTVFLSLSYWERKEIGDKLFIGGGILSMLSSLTLMIAGALELKMVLSDAASAALFKGSGIGMSIGTIAVAIGAYLLFTSEAPLYFSPKAQGLDCGTLKERRPCKARHPAQVKKEFLADPFAALRFFKEKQGSTGEQEMRLVYLADAQGAAMLKDAVDIVSYARLYDPKDAIAQQHLKKMAYINSIHWQRLSMADKIKYLHNFAEEVKQDVGKF